jgi:hypothetical protein
VIAAEGSANEDLPRGRHRSGTCVVRRETAPVRALLAAVLLVLVGWSEPHAAHASKHVQRLRPEISGILAGG